MGILSVHITLNALGQQARPISHGCEDVRLREGLGHGNATRPKHEVNHDTDRLC